MLHNMTFDYYKEEKIDIPCNACGGRDFFSLAQHSKNNLHARTNLCKTCGLIFISPRMTARGYDNYYKYHYREDRAKIKETQTVDPNESFERSRTFGRAVAGFAMPFIDQEGTMLDVGSDNGGLLQGFKDVFPKMELVGIEPSVAFSEYANKRGIKTYTCLFEDFDDSFVHLFRNIVCAQTLNHLLDPRGFFEWAHAHLADGGHLILVVKNFRHQCKRAGQIEAGVQIDHPFMFTPETLRAMVYSAGFSIDYLDVDEYKKHSALSLQKKQGLSKGHIRIVARKDTHRAPSLTVSARKHYLHERIVFWRPYLRLYYVFRYSSRSDFLRRLWRKRG
jgi:SAM-dependent methyltransferase